MTRRFENILDAIEEKEQQGFSLTPQETSILKDLVRGKTSLEIATEKNISVKTVEVHRHTILKKSGFDSTVKLVVWYYEQRQHIQPEPEYHIVRTLDGIRFYYMGYFGFPNPEGKANFPAFTADKKMGLVIAVHKQAFQLLGAIQHCDKWEVIPITDE